jgi:hypothetical protein
MIDASRSCIARRSEAGAFTYTVDPNKGWEKRTRPSARSTMPACREELLEVLRDGQGRPWIRPDATAGDGVRDLEREERVAMRGPMQPHDRGMWEIHGGSFAHEPAERILRQRPDLQPGHRPRGTREVDRIAGRSRSDPQRRDHGDGFVRQPTEHE